MTTKERDPRIDPRPGDVVKKSDREFEVLAIENSILVVVQNGFAYTGIALSEWSDTLGDAEVIAKGSDE